MTVTINSLKEEILSEIKKFDVDAKDLETKTKTELLALLDELTGSETPSESTSETETVTTVSESVPAQTDESVINSGVASSAENVAISAASDSRPIAEGITETAPTNIIPVTDYIAAMKAKHNQFLRANGQERYAVK